MKRRLISFIVAVLLVVWGPMSCLAVEIGYDFNKECVLRWMYKQNGKYTLTVSNQLPSSYSVYPRVQQALNNLNNQSPTQIQVVAASISTSKVDIFKASQTMWDTYNWNIAIATTVPRSTSGTMYWTYNHFPEYGNIWSDYCAVYFTYDDPKSSSQQSTRYVMHELLHTYGMGHYLGDSLTNAGYNLSSCTLTSYDISEFNRMYK